MSPAKTPLHISFLFSLLSLFGLFHFAFGWLGYDSSGIFPGVAKNNDGATHLFASNGSRHLGITLLLLIGAITRRPAWVKSGLIVRIICEIFDTILYGFILTGQFGTAMFAAGLLLWEGVSMYQVVKLEQKQEFK